MRKRTNKLLAVLLTGAMAMSMGACGNGGASTDNTQKKGSDDQVTIKITWWGGDARHEATQKVLDLYTESHPNVKFEAIPAGWDGYFEKLSTQAASGSIDTRIALILPWFFGAAFFIFMLVQFFRGVPKELDEAAEIDGCGRIAILFRILAPVVKPSIITASIFAFYWIWQDFFQPLIFMSTTSKFTLSLALNMFLDPSTYNNYGGLFAMSVLSLLPTIIFFIIFQRYDSLQMATFTITEKGYSLVNAKGETMADVAADFEAGPDKPSSYMGKVASLLYNRYVNGAKPIAMVSTDNCSHNGDKLYAAIDEFAKAWSKNGVAEAGFADYVNSDKVSFTWSMIDKITPRPDANVEKMLLDDGVEGLDPVITSKNTYVAPFVNAEETEYLVIEDKFPNGREALEAGGLMFTDRETVDKVEKMKVCTCLNPLHTALAIYGCLLGYDKISEEMKDDDLRKMIEIIGYKEGLPVVVNPGILDPKKFIKTVLEVRLPNPFMPDTPQRIATDTSQKLAIRFGETIKAYMASDELEASDLKLIPLVFAGWLRYLMAVDDNGNAFEPSSDPMLAELTPYLKDIKWNDEQAEKKILPILAKSEIFGVNLAEAGLLCRVVKYFKELIAGVGAVRTTLHKYVSNN